MYTRNTRIKGADKLYVCTFIISFIISIYLNFDAFWLGEMGKYLGVDIANPTQKYNTIARVLIITTSLLFFHKRSNIANLPLLGKTLFAFSIYLLFSCLLIKDLDRAIDYVDTYIISSLWIYMYVFMYTLRLSYNIDKYIPKFIIAFCIFSVILFLRNYYLNNQIGHTGWSYIESYYAITLIPAITLLKSKYKYLLFLIIVITSIIAAKRTGLITSIIAIVLYIILVGKNLSHKIKTILIGSVLLFLMFLVLNQFMAKEINDITERIENIKEDEGSGRKEIYSSVYKEIIDNPDIVSFLFGKGYNEVINSKDSRGFSAHNEFLEVAYDYGIVGLGIFLFIFIAIFRTYCETKAHEYKVAIFLSLFIFFTFSLTSHTILNTTNIVYLCMFWGYVEAKNKTEKKISKQQQQ